MPRKYRGQIKVEGPFLRGWLSNVLEPEEPIDFNLRVDGVLRGMFVAHAARRAQIDETGESASAFAFEIRISPDWVTGNTQIIHLEDPGDEQLDLVLEAKLGPHAGLCFADPPRVEAPRSKTRAPPPQGGRPEDLRRVFRASLVFLREGKFEAAQRTLRSAFRLESDMARRDLANVLGRLARQDLSPALKRRLLTEQVEIFRMLAGSKDRMIQINAQISLATALSSIGRHREAAEAADVALKWVPNSVKALVAKAKALVPQNNILEACALYERVLEIEPHNQSMRTTLRVMNALAQEEAPRAEESSIAVLRRADTLDVVLGSWHSLDAQPASIWICTSGAESEAEITAGDLEAVSGCTGGFVAAGSKEFWRREAIKGLVESGLVKDDDSPGALRKYSPFYGLSRDDRVSMPCGTAVVSSRNGGFKFGGGEHFLESAAEHYADLGYSPVIVGTRQELIGQERALGAQRYIFIEESVASFRRLVLERDAALVHAISGMGFIVAEALKFTNIPFLYGVHFWRELLGDAQDLSYFDEATGAPLARKEFRVVLSKAAVVYANSRYTQKMIEESFGVRCPIAFSVPRELHPS